VLGPLHPRLRGQVRHAGPRGALGHLVQPPDPFLAGELAREREPRRERLVRAAGTLQHLRRGGQLRAGLGRAAGRERVVRGGHHPDASVQPPHLRGIRIVQGTGAGERRVGLRQRAGEIRMLKDVQVRAFQRQQHVIPIRLVQRGARQQHAALAHPQPRALERDGGV
jgi:hypothetical protein